jgi:3-hydroxybutyryl-CoA dehydrogenase
MNVLVVGNPGSQAEFNSKFGSGHVVNFKSSRNFSRDAVEKAEIIFDFDISAGDSHGYLYLDNPDAVLFLNSVMTTISTLVDTFKWSNPVIGFNGMSQMFDRPLLELTTDRQSPDYVKGVCGKLGTDYRLVEDRVGMVTPRVVCMIINEAFYTVEEGTAIEQDIDQAMKLGTNYPAGPFEMASTIGLPNICKLLSALERSTGDSRYKICPLLRKQACD